MADTIDAKNLEDVKKEMMTCTMCGFCKRLPRVRGYRLGHRRGQGRVILAYGLMQKEIPADPLWWRPTSAPHKDCERRCPRRSRSWRW